MGAERGRAWPIVAACALWVLTYFGARAAMEVVDYGSAMAYVAAWAPALPFAAVMWLVVRGARSTDELEQRMQLEALVVAFPLTMLLLMVLGLMELGVPLDREDWGYRHVLGFLPLFYAVGLLLARRRYRA